VVHNKIHVSNDLFVLKTGSDIKPVSPVIDFTGRTIIDTGRIGL
jgi:hypothetical protein